MKDSETTSDSRGFSGNLSPELREQRERLKPQLLERHSEVTDADIDAALLDYHRETRTPEDDDEMLAELEKRLGFGS